MRRRWLLFLVLVLWLTGCDLTIDLPMESLNPIFTANDVIFDPALLGHWTSNEPNEIVRLERGDKDSYVMVFEKTQHDVKEESVYEVHLVSLGGDKYIDVVPQQVPDLSAIYKFQMDSAKKGARFSPALQRVGDGVYVQVLGPTPGKGTIQELQVKLRRAHWFGKVQLHENNLSLDFLSSAWVEKVIKEKRIQAQRARIDEENSNKNWVLTGSTAELQSLIVRAADEPGSFGGGGVAFQKVQ